MKVGDVFVSATETEVEECCRSRLLAAEKKLSELVAIREGIENRMASLKADLYAKFGTKRINLEMR